MKQKKQENLNWEYLWYALYAFAGLGLEIALLNLLEPALFNGIKSNEYSVSQSMIHWILTIVCWGAISLLLIRNAKKKLSFSVVSDTKPSQKGITLSALLVLICILLNVYDWGTLKIIGEFQQKGLLLFAVQYIYYLFEVGLVFLIIAFGQEFFEKITKKKSFIPWGGLLLCCTWGTVHWLTKGSITAGLGTMAFSIIYGMIYLFLNRSAKYSWLAMAAAFII